MNEVDQKQAFDTAGAGLYRPDALSVIQLAASKYWRKNLAVEFVFCSWVSTCCEYYTHTFAVCSGWMKWSVQPKKLAVLWRVVRWLMRWCWTQISGHALAPSSGGELLVAWLDIRLYTLSDSCCSSWLPRMGLGQSPLIPSHGAVPPLFLYFPTFYSIF